MADDESRRAGCVYCRNAQYVFETLVLGCFLFYADIVSDVISLGRFWRHGQRWFFWINAGGIGLNMVSSGVFGALFRVNGGLSSLRGLLVGFFQLHPLVTTWHVLSTGQKLDDDDTTVSAIYRAFELIESCCSLLVQGYVVVWDVSLSGSNQLQLQASACISLLSLANGLVILDKTPLASEDRVAKVKSMVSGSFVVAFIYRVFELILSFGSLFLFQLATRPYGGFVALTVVVVCMLIVLGVRLVANVVGRASRDTVMLAVYVGSALLTAVPLCFFNVSPALGAPSLTSPMNLGPPRLHYFAFRLATVGLMLAYLVHMAGSLGAIWDLWRPYNASAVFLAYAVAISLIGYTTTFLLVLIHYPDKRSHGLLRDYDLEE